MLGSITPTKSNLSKTEIERYKAYYCGLCHELKRKSGKTGMSALSYDMVFLAMLLTDLYNVNLAEGFERCAAKPIKEHKYLVSQYTEYAADMQMLLSYYSELDKVNDRDDEKEEKKLKAYASYLKEIETQYPRQSKMLKDGLRQLSDAEAEGEKDAVKMSYIFASSISAIFNPIENDFFSPSLLSLGAALGRFIYLMDAFLDRKKDEKKGAYNPLLSLDNEIIESLLMNAATDASSAFESLALDDNLAILRNIIYSGIWKNYDKEKNNDR